MTIEIPKQNWKESLDSLSRDLDGWETHIEVLNNEIGAQVIADGLPFHGLTMETTTDSKTKIEVLVGNGTESHLTHTIVDPIRIAFKGTGIGPAGVLDIEAADGTQILVKFIQPFPVLVEYVNAELTYVAGSRN